jgi:MFS family permease
VIQGAGAAIMFPGRAGDRDRGLPRFPSAARRWRSSSRSPGGLTSVGPIAGGYLTEIDWRAIFWVNVPVALIALLLTWRARPANERHPAPIDYRGTVLISGGMGLAVLGLQQSATWGWDDPATWACIVVGLALLAAFVVYQLRVPDPLIPVRIFTDRAFAMENVVLFLLMIPFVPLFFFSSLYSQISLGYDASNAGLYLLIFFTGFATASQIGGRVLDTRGARPSVVVGCAMAAIGFALWAGQLPDLDLSSQWPWIVLGGAGVGLVLGPANTDAINRAPRTSYGEATGITQTVRNFGSASGSRSWARS